MIFFAIPVETFRHEILSLLAIKDCKKLSAVSNKGFLKKISATFQGYELMHINNASSNDLLWCIKYGVTVQTILVNGLVNPFVVLLLNFFHKTKSLTLAGKVGVENFDGILKIFPNARVEMIHDRLALYPNPDNMEEFIPNLSLEKLELQINFNMMFLPIFKECGRLKELNLYFCDDAILATVAKYCPNLEIINVFLPDL